MPSSNVTMESELPELFRRRERISLERFTFHSARTRMTEVTAEALAAMDRQAGRCAAELADAECDAIAYAHVHTPDSLIGAAGVSAATSVVISAGALIAAARALGAARIAMIAPYPPELTGRVIGYLAAAGVEVVSALSLDITDNRAVGRIDPTELLPLISRLDLGRAQALLLSACVQMPSLPVVDTAQDRTGLPVFTAVTATARGLLDVLGLDPVIPGAGALLEGPGRGSPQAVPVQSGPADRVVSL